MKFLVPKIVPWSVFFCVLVAHCLPRCTGVATRPATDYKNSCFLKADRGQMGRLLELDLYPLHPPGPYDLEHRTETESSRWYAVLTGNHWNPYREEHDTLLKEKDRVHRINDCEVKDFIQIQGNGVFNVAPGIQENRISLLDYILITPAKDLGGRIREVEITRRGKRFVLRPADPIRLLLNLRILPRPEELRSVNETRASAKTALREIMTDLKSNRIDVNLILEALKRRKELREYHGSELRALLSRGGTLSGLAAIILRNETAKNRILIGQDPEARLALLACGRMVREPMSLKKISLLSREDEILTRAVDLYLEARDSEASRRMLWGRYPDRALLLGARPPIDPGSNSYRALDELEEQLRKQVRSGKGPTRIFAILSARADSNSEEVVIGVFGNRAQIYRRVVGSGYYDMRRLSVREYRDFLNFIQNRRVSSMTPFFGKKLKGVQYEYIDLKRSGGRRLYMNNPDEGPHALLVKRIKSLALRGKLERRYFDTHRIPDKKVLFGYPDYPVRAVCLGNRRLLALVGGDPNRHNQHEANFEFPVWRVVRRGAPGPIVPRPRECPVPDKFEDVPGPERFFKYGRQLNSPAWRTKLGRGFVREGEWNGTGGLWKTEIGKQPRLLLKCNCAHPIVTPDGKWLIAAKADMTWANPNHVFRMNLITKKVFVLDIPPADTFFPVAYIDAHDRVLLRREKQYRLLNVETGESTIVEGEFSPLHRKIPFQKAEKPHLVWAAIGRFEYPRVNGQQVQNQKRRVTRVGIYNLGTFSFMPVATFPGLNFDTDRMRVDSARNAVYVAYRGVLLKLPLRRNLPFQNVPKVSR